MPTSLSQVSIYRCSYIAIANSMLLLALKVRWLLSTFWTSRTNHINLKVFHTKRYEIGSSEGNFPLEVEAYYCQIYFEALDLIVCGIQNRFDQPGYRVYCKLEDLLV